MDLLGALNTFVRVVETGSFSAVARETGNAHTAVTRQIAQLEQHFGVRLLHRTTRRLNLTSDGEILVGHARELIDEAGVMERELGRHRTDPVGTVRLGAPIGLGLFFAPRLMPLLRRHAGLSVELVVYEGACDMMESRLDLALFHGSVPDASLIARQVGEFGRCVVAAPAYLEQCGTPLTPAELSGHVCIVRDAGGERDLWRFTGPGGSVSVPVSGRLATNNDRTALLMARSGCGIACLPEMQVVHDVRAGRLVPLLPDYAPEAVAIHSAYPSRRHLPPKTRVVLDFVAEAIRSGTQLLPLQDNAVVPMVAQAA